MVIRELITRLGFKTDTSGIDKADNSVGSFFKNLSLKSVAGAASLAVVAKKFIDLGSAALMAAADMEMMTTQFEVMLGSAEAADDMMKNLNEFAASTPFALDNLAKGTQQLLSFGVEADSVIDTMRMLGDTAGGNAEKLNGLVLAYGKVQTKGKASLEEISMMAERGLPIYDVLAKQLNVTKEGLFGLISDGEVSAEHITAAFKQMTSEGGMFYEGMKKQSMTLHGMISTMQDNFKLAIAEAGKSLMPLAKEVVEFMIEVAQAIKPMLVAVFTVVSAVLTPIFRVLKAILTPIMFLLRVFFERLNMLFGIIGKVIEIWQAMWKAIISFILAPFRLVINVFQRLFSELSERFMPVIEGVRMVFEILRIVFSALADIVSTWLTPAITVISELFSWMGEVIYKFLAPAFEFVGKVFDYVGQKISEFVDWLISIVNKLPGVNIDRKEIKQRISAKMPSASQRMAVGASPKTTNVSMQNNITMNGTGNTKEDVTRIAESVFTIQLKQVLVDAGI